MVNEYFNLTKYLMISAEYIYIRYDFLPHLGILTTSITTLLLDTETFSYFIFRGFDLQCIHRGTSGYTSIPIPNFQHFYCLLWVIIKICSLS